MNNMEGNRMIFETLAAMADYADDKKFNFSSTAAQAKAVLADVKQTSAAKTVIADVTKSGAMQFSNETLIVGGVTKVNNQGDWFNQHMVGLQQKTPRKAVEAASSNVVY
jgi:hypothetical protein